MNVIPHLSTTLKSLVKPHVGMGRLWTEELVPWSGSPGISITVLYSRVGGKWVAMQVTDLLSQIESDRKFLRKCIHKTLFSNVIYRHHKQANEPKKRCKTKGFHHCIHWAITHHLYLKHVCLYAPQNVYSKSAYHTTVWLLQCTTAYKFTGVQRLPHFRLPDGSDWVAINLAAFSEGPADSPGTLMLNTACWCHHLSLSELAVLVAAGPQTYLHSHRLQTFNSALILNPFSVNLWESMGREEIQRHCHQRRPLLCLCRMTIELVPENTSCHLKSKARLKSWALTLHCITSKCVGTDIIF